MKMSIKLIIIFSVLAVLLTVSFSFITYQTNLNNLYESTSVSLKSLCTKMQNEIDQYARIMNYSIEELSSNVEFMDAFYSVAESDSDDPSNSSFSAMTRMSQLIYQFPLQTELIRLSIFNEDGFYISNIFEKTKSVTPYSDEALDAIASFDCLDQLKKEPFKMVLRGVHNDPWTVTDDVLVFSLLRAAVWHGKVIGYFEASAPLDDLADIFLVLENEGISTQAIFDDGTDFFRMWQDDIVYEDLPLNEVTTYHIDGVSDRWVVHTHSSFLNLNIYASQEIDALGSTRMDILKRSILTMLPILLVALVFVVLISTGLTSSIRKLGKKIKNLPDDFLSRPDLNEPTTVVKPADRELYDVEQSFNNMLTTLRTSHANELALREGALKAQLNALQLQINPHFIYNTLNIISAKGLECGSIEVTELCEQFAQMLRYSTDTRSQTASLKDEIDNVRKYLYLSKARYEDMLEYEINVPDDMMDIIIPKLTLQPIIENALKYGTKDSSSLRKILINAVRSDNEIRLTIRDNGNGFDWETINRLQRAFRKIEASEDNDDPDTGNHIGIINTFRRLHYYSKGRMHMNIFNDNGAVIEITQQTCEVEDNV